MPANPVCFTDSIDHLLAFVKHCPFPVTQADLDGVITFWSPAAEQFYGYTAADAVGQHVSMLVPEELADGPQRLVELLRAGQVVENFETVGLTRDGRRIPVAVTIFPMLDAAGQIVGSSSISQDITERKLAERALVESESRFRAAFDVTPAAMSLIGLDGRFILVNRATCTMLGYTPGEMQGMPITQVLPAEDAQLDVAADLLQRGMSPGVDPELPLVRRDGSACWVSMSVAVLEDEQGQPAYFLTHGQDLTEQRAAQERLAKARAHLHDILDRVGSAFVEVDWEWRIARMNAAAEAVLGGSRSQMVGRKLQDVLDPATLADFAGVLESAMRERQPVYVAEYYYKPRQIWLAVHIVPTAEGLAVHVRDVTEQRSVEDDLRQAETRFQTLVENLPAGVYLLGPGSSGNILYLSPCFETMTGYSLEQSKQYFSDGGWLGLVHPEDRERVRREALSAIDGVGRLSLEYRFRTADGRYVWMENFSSVIRDDDGQIVAWLGILIDVTGQREARAAMARLAAIVDSADDIIYSRTVDGVITSWNAGAERITGYAADEVIGRTLMDVFPADNVQLPSVAELENRGANWRFDDRVHRRDGECIDIAMSVSRLVDADGNVTGVSVIARDISDRLATEREVRAALEAAESGERTKALFLAMMSHELRTPLQSVLGYADLLLGGHDGELNPLQLEDIGYIHQGATRMVSLIGQMLDLSRMESGRLDMKNEVVDLSAVLGAAFQAIKPEASARGLALVLEIPRELPDVLGDTERVSQILLSMADNAVKFTGSGEIRLTAQVQGDWVEASVADTGIGIAEDEIPHVFDSFRQRDTRLSRRHGGAGLGLAIAQRLARQMEGDVTVSSAPGKGSTFTLRLPSAASLRRRWQVTSGDAAVV
ncbi:MAG: PAS domain S-box protein [Chloroflexota bacterium]|nr:PAS domain S-box protein [Chloroflexota bacterium]